VASCLTTTVACEHLAARIVRASRADPGDFGVDVPDGMQPSVPDAEAMREAVADAVLLAHREVLRYTVKAETRAHTTIVAGMFLDGELHYGWVGDSRAYLINETRRSVERLTRDHGVVEELRESGAVDDVEAKVHPRSNEITRALGGTGVTDPESADIAVDTRTVPVFADDVLLVTSDGLLDAQSETGSLYDLYVETGKSDEAASTIWNAVVTDDELREAVVESESLSTATSDLIDMANERGGGDNLSLLLLRDPALRETPDDDPPIREVDPATVADRETVIVPED
jgi:serine/threonine protein phosphatase PrpC